MFCRLSRYLDFHPHVHALVADGLFLRDAPPEHKADLEDLAQHILRNPFSVEKMTLESPGDLVIYRSRLNAKINRNFEVFTPTDFLAAITQQIPDKGPQMVRYHGWYSDKMRGVRHCGLPSELGVRRPGLSPPPQPANERTNVTELRAGHL